MQFVDEAARLLNKAGLFETVNEVYKTVIPIAEANRNFTKLAEIHNVSNLSTCKEVYIYIYIYIYIHNLYSFTS